jgi:homoserine O-acetyltransferase
MDMHDVGRNRGGIDKALSEIKGQCLVVGIDSDTLYPLHEQEELAQLIPTAKLNIIKSTEGHDGFLLEQNQLAGFIDEFLN